MSTATAAKTAQLAAVNPYEAEEKLGPSAVSLVEGLVNANLWPRFGQIAPLNGSDPASMRLNIQQVISDPTLAPELLLAIHNAVLVLSTVDFGIVQRLPWLSRMMREAAAVWEATE